MSSPNTTKAGFFSPSLEVLNTYKKSSKVTLCAMYISTCAPVPLPPSVFPPEPKLLHASKAQLQPGMN